MYNIWNKIYKKLSSGSSTDWFTIVSLQTYLFSLHWQNKIQLVVKESCTFLQQNLQHKPSFLENRSDRMHGGYNRTPVRHQQRHIQTRTHWQSYNTHCQHFDMLHTRASSQCSTNRSLKQNVRAKKKTITAIWVKGTLHV